uniref:Fe2OG dioxygenase domain-containing protein n=1 Tax=Macrostomum lignano TaxID=282301 RepID=A0A1I8J221_9PLAT
ANPSAASRDSRVGLSDRLISMVMRVLLGTIRPLTGICFEIVYRLFVKRRRVPPLESPLLGMSAVALADAIRRREVTSEAVVRASIDRMRLVHPIINAVVWERYEAALQDARRVDAMLDSDPDNPEWSREAKPFLGVPATVKEAFGLVGGTQSVGLWLRTSIRSERDAVCVERMKSAGCIPLCLTNVSELCMWWESHNRVNGITGNPYDSRRIAGGSSGGEGANVGAGCAPVGLGSDIGGSIRMPAFFNGVFGHKATAYMIPNAGQYPDAIAEGRYFMLSGPIVSHAEDLLPMVRLMAGPENSARLLIRPCIEFADSGDSIWCSPVEPRIRECIRQAAEHLRADLGLPVQKVQLRKLRLSPHLWSSKMKLSGEERFAVQMGGGVKLNCYLELIKWCLLRSHHTLPAIGLGLFEQFGSENLDRRLAAICDQLKAEMEELLGDDGVLLYPAHPTSAPYHHQPLTLLFNFAYTGIFNVLGLPATSIPMGLDHKGMPIGLQAVANMHNDRYTLLLAELLENKFGGWAPDSLFYVPDFVTKDEEASLLGRVYAAPKPRWTCLSNRRLQNWGGLPHPKGMVSEPLPDWLERLIDRVAGLGLFSGRPNHVLVNEYLSGQGIMPHHDGSLYEPTVATVSLGSHTLLDFYSPVPADSGSEAGSASLASRYIGSAVLQPRSLVLVTGLMYTRYMHGIAERCSDRLVVGGGGGESPSLFNWPQLDGCSVAADADLTLDRGTRVSLTIRRVPKVALGLSKLLMKR